MIYSIDCQYIAGAAVMDDHSVSQNLRQQGMHHMRINLLAFTSPGAAYSFRLLFVRNRKVQPDQDCLIFTYFTVDDVVLVGTFVKVGGGTYLFHAGGIYFPLNIHPCH